MEVIYHIKFFSFWHIGSGLSSGPGTDALVLKDAAGLPYLPGKSLKGYLRESTNWLKNSLPGFDDQWQERILGSPTNWQEGSAVGEKSSLFISNAQVHPQQASLLQEKNSSEAALYRYLSSTAINEDGVAVEQSLRTIEVAVPLDLYGFISGVEERDIPQLKLGLQAIKHMGAGKTRGLGKCTIELISTKDA